MNKRQRARQDLEETGDGHVVRARSPFAWLRPILLTLGLLMVAGVALMIAAYQFGRSEPITAVAEAPAARPDEDQVVTGQGFDYTQTTEGNPVFRIRAEKSRQDRDGNSYLETVVLDVFREDGDSYTVKSERARVDEKNWDARLEGDVVMTGWENLVLEARAIELRHHGQLMTSDGAVEFQYPPNYVGRASELRVDRKEDVITLSGGVHLHTVEGAERPMRLDGERLVYQSGGGIIRAVGEASLKTDTDSIAAHFLTLFLAEDGSTMQSVRARWNVVGQGWVENELGEVSELEYHGQFLDLMPDAANPESRRIKLDGEGEAVTLKMTDPSGLSRIFTGLYLLGHTRGNRLVQLEGVGEPLTLEERIDVDEAPFLLRRACAIRITARFLPDGGLARAQLENGVELHDLGVSIGGGRRAALNIEDGTFRVEGQEVLLLNDRAEVRAPQFSYGREQGVIRAQGGVRAVLAESATAALRGTPLGQGRGPIQVEADEAFWTVAPPTFSFSGAVRAWRDQSLILADQLNGDEAEQKISASGDVRTVWMPNRGAGGLSFGGEGEAEEGQPRPIEVDSELLTYLSEERQLAYHGAVEMRQGSRTINCEGLVVSLDGDGKAQLMTCDEQVRMADLEGRRAEGDRAVYTLADREVEIFGDKVVLVDGDQNRLEGRYLIYDMRNGQVSVRTRPPGEEAESGGYGAGQP